LKKLGAAPPFPGDPVDEDGGHKKGKHKKGKGK
jgi:hypothetical protein